MNLPNYFLGDVSDPAGLSPTVIRDACASLKANRARYLAGRTTAQIIKTISALAAEWLEPSSTFRQLALWEGPRHTGFSRQTLEQGMDAYFKQLTAERLLGWICQEFGHPERLDQFCASEPELKQDRASFARAPEFIVHIGGGRLPNPAFTSLVQGLLLRSAQFLKCASGASFLPRIFAHSIYESDAKLASCLEIAEWKGGSSLLEEPLLAEADCVTAMGSDETISQLRLRLPAPIRFVPYGHRVSFGYVTREILSGVNPGKVAARAARDIAAWNQLGCLSPHLIYAETGGKTSPEKFATLLADELGALEQSDPRGELPQEEAAGISTRRSFYQLRSAAGCQTKLWSSRDSTAWTVVFEEDPQFQISCLNRFIYVKSVADPAQAMAGADKVRGHTSTVGLAATEDRAAEIARAFGQWGATRICPLGQMQNPSLLWRHDGRPALGDLVTWIDWEQSS